MKRLFLIPVLLLGGLSFADNLPTTVSVAVDKTFVPVGFDDNDRVQFAVGGVFRNTCYRVGPYAVRTDTEQKRITVQQQAYQYSGTCLQLMVPFNQIIDVGLIGPGDWTVVDQTSGKEIGKLPITRGTNPGPDDFLYAPVTDAYIVTDTVSKKHLLVMTGQFQDRCSVLEDIRVNYSDNVIIVQPIVNRPTEVNCAAEPVRFLRTYELKGDLSGTYLLHVRVLNGQAVNRFVEFP